MGNQTSSESDIKDICKCLICWENIDKKNLLLCTRCNIQMHDNCFKNFSSIKNIDYCFCPHCQRIGTIGKVGQELSRKRKSIFEKSI